MNNVIETYGRNMVQVDILKSMGAAAPSFGMIGTLVGLIIMLDTWEVTLPNLERAGCSTDDNALWGASCANHFILATKMNQRERLIRFRNYLVVEGLVLHRKEEPSLNSRPNEQLFRSIDPFRY